MKFARQAALILFLLLSACSTVVVDRPLSEPAVPDGMFQPTPGEEKIVTLVAPTLPPFSETPTEVVSLDYPPAPTSTAVVPPRPVGEATPPQTPEARTFRSLADLGIESTTLQDRVTGFAFEYPAGWQVTDLPDEVKAESTGYSITLISFVAPPEPKKQEGLVEGQAKIDVNSFEGVGETPEEVASWLKNQAEQAELPARLLTEEKWVLPSGIEAVYLVFETSSGNTAQLITTINGRAVFFSGMGDLGLFPTIAGSLRAENPF